MELEDNFTNGQNYLMLCELHNENIHGKNEDSCNDIDGHYLVYGVYDPLNLFHKVNIDTYVVMNDILLDEMNENDLLINIIALKSAYNELINYDRRWTNHPIIRNYFNIISRPNYIKPEIGEYIILPTQEAIAILKTFWIRIIQRKWKKVFHQRQDVLRMRSNPRNIIIRENTGRWPSVCNHMPTLNGMLHDLKTICGGQVRLSQ